jgi:septation ring formation regulator EzrA
MSERELVEIVCADIRRKAGEIIADEKNARKRFYALKSQADGVQLKQDENALKKVDKQLAELDTKIEKAFDRYALGGALVETFERLAQKCEAEKIELTERAEQLRSSIEKQKQQGNEVETFISLMKEYVNITEIDRATAVALIESITVSAKAVEPREIVIQYKFVGNV